MKQPASRPGTQALHWPARRPRHKGNREARSRVTQPASVASCSLNGAPCSCQTSPRSSCLPGQAEQEISGFLHAAGFSLYSAASSAINTFPRERFWVKSLAPGARGGAFSISAPAGHRHRAARPASSSLLCCSSQFSIPSESNVCGEQEKPGESVRCYASTASHGPLAVQHPRRPSLLPAE